MIKKLVKVKYIIVRKNKLDFNSLVLIEVLSRLLNMLTMFLPIKIMFLVSGTKSFGFLLELESRIGKDNFILLLVAIVIGAFLGNVVVQILKSTKQNVTTRKIREKTRHRKQYLSYSKVKNLFLSLVVIYSDFFLILVVCLGILVISVEMLFAYVFFTTVILFWFPIFSEKIVKSFGGKISLKQVLVLSKFFFFLPMFILLIVLVLLSRLDVMSSVFCVILLRMVSSSFSSLLVALMPFRLLLDDFDV